MGMSQFTDNEYKTDYEIQQDISAFFDKEAQRIIDSYLERHPGHDISDHAAFTLVGISCFFLCWYVNRDKIEMSDDFYDKVISMYMKLIPCDWHFLENIESEMFKAHLH